VASAVLALSLSGGLAAGTLTGAAPASAAVTLAPLTAAETRARQYITSTFNAMNTFRASNGMPPVKLGLDASDLLQASVNDRNIEVYGPDSILNSDRLRGYAVSRMCGHAEEGVEPGAMGDAILGLLVALTAQPFPTNVNRPVPNNVNLQRNCFTGLVEPVRPG
jgi:hypothetical protein